MVTAAVDSGRTVEAGAEATARFKRATQVEPTTQLAAGAVLAIMSAESPASVLVAKVATVATSATLESRSAEEVATARVVGASEEAMAMVEAVEAAAAAA